MRTMAGIAKGFALLVICGIASRGQAQTWHYSIAAGTGTLTYTETESVTGSCPVSTPPSSYQPITQYLFNSFAYNGQSLSGSISYVSVPAPSSYCPSTGWQGPIPYPLDGPSLYIFFTPSLSSAGTASIDELTLSANPTSSTYGTSVQFQATQQFPNASGTVTFSDGSTTLGSASLSSDVATLSISTLAVGSHSISASYSGGDPSVTSPTLSFTVNAQSQTISFSPPTPVSYGVSPISLSASGGGSGNPVIFSLVSGPATLSGSTLTITGVGPVVVAANQAGNSNYSAASQVSQTITVNKAIPSITWGTPSAVPNGYFLNSVQLNANANTGGTFSYTPSAGTAVTPGTQTLSLTFTPSNTADYTTATASVPLLVNLAPATGLIMTVAGNNQDGYAGDGSAAYQAEFGLIEGVAVDSHGNLYISDWWNNRVRTVSASTGAVNTFAGNGTAGYSGNGGAAVNAEINHPGGLAIDSQNNLYIADTYNNVVRMVTPAGTISTVAGTGVSGYSGNGGLATSATLNEPTSVAVDSAGDIYISDANNVIREVSASTKYISTIAGGGTQNPSNGNGNGGPATSAFMYPEGIAVDSSNNLYVADVSTESVRKVTPSGTITAFAGNGTIGYSGDGGPATSASLHYPGGVAVDHSGNVYIADSYNNVIRKVSSFGIITSAGDFGDGYTGDGGEATAARLSEPWAVAADSSNNVYIADTNNYVVRAVGAGLLSPPITWAAPFEITYGTALSSTQLNASSPIAGTLSYSPGSGTVLAAGQQSLTVTLAPTDTVDYATTSYTVPLTVNPATPVISWTTPASITDTTTLSSTQLNAAATVNGNTVAGTFTYTPAAGSKLSPGSQLLSVSFLPSNTSNYNSAVGNTSIQVNSGSTADSGTVQLWVNSGSGYANVASTTYASGATPSSIASGLVSGKQSGAPITLTAVNDELTIASATAASGTDYPFYIETSSWNSSAFTNPSFAYPEITGTLEGGAANNTSDRTVYSYTVPSSGGYDAASNLKSYSDSTSAGVIMGTWNFTYDNLNRLLTGAASGGGPWTGSNLCWAYDAFGNRTAEAKLSTACPQNLTPNLSFNSNNQITSALYHYDATGNVLADTQNQYLYDAEGRLCAVASPNGSGGIMMTGYIYDADGTRVSKGSIQQWSCNPATNGYATTSDYILGTGGEQLSEYTMSTGGVMAWLHTNVWTAGGLIATYSQDSALPTTVQQGFLHFYFDDPLGSRRVQTDYAGNTEQTCTSLPFGDGESCPPTPTEHLFSGKERDAESGNDYFGARYYASSMGRFMSPDWSAKEEPVPYAKLDDPQTLNLYSYVQNNPLIRVDEDGHDALKIVDPRTGHVTILIPVHMTGRGATKERVHQILQRANHVHSEDPNVTVKVIYTKTPVNGVMNTLDISPRQDNAMCGAAGECVNHLGGNKGHIDSRNTGDDDAGPHETMHYAGAKDKYVEGVDQNGNRVTPPAPGYDGTDLMSNRPGTNLKPAETQEMQQNPTTKPCTKTANGQTCP